MTNRSRYKKFDVKTKILSHRAFFAFSMIFVIAISPLSADMPYFDEVYAQQQEQISEDRNNNDNPKINNKEINIGNKKNVFYSLSSINSSSLDTASFTLSSNIKTSNNTLHNIELEVVVLPTGMPAYKMINHTKTQNISSSATTNDYDTTDVTSEYSKIATIPGPTLVVNEGDLVKVSIKDKNGNIQTSEEFVASKPGTFLYMDNSRKSETGLFGAVIVNPEDKLTTGLIKGKIQGLSLNEIDKDIILFMVGSTFWGREIDNHDNNRQIPLWANPNIGGVRSKNSAFMY